MEQENREQIRTENLEDFLKVSRQMSRRQLKALDGLIPMTQELFDGCVEECITAGARRQFERLTSEYPQLYGTYIEKLGETAKRMSVRDLRNDPVWRGISVTVQTRQKHQLLRP